MCEPTYFRNGKSCVACPVGTDCADREGVTLSTLPIKRGYYRPADTSDDVRRCPDAGANCSSAALATECEQSSSGCFGGDDPSAACRPGLEGTFCQLCSNRTAEGGRIYYSRASDTEPAKCKPCGDIVGLTAGIGAATYAPMHDSGYATPP